MHSHNLLYSATVIMAKPKSLKAALERHKGVDHKLERQKKLQKQAEKRKKQKKQSVIDVGAVEDASTGAEEDAEAQTLTNGEEHQHEELAADDVEALEQADGAAGGWETDESEDAEQDEEDGGVDLEGLEDDSESESEDEIQQNGTSAEAEEDIPLSDIESLASEEKGDVIPHQRLTINNTAALQRSLKSFALPSGLPFSAIQSTTSAEPVQIADIEDDLSRELAFYKQSLDAAKRARSKLKKEGIPFSRPADYFAEMVKSEEQMGKVRAKMVDEAARKKASSDARRQRDLKKFGKAVQVAKLQERDKAKRDTMDKINLLKRKRQGAELGATKEDDMFDVALEDAADSAKGDRADRRARGGRDGEMGRKRQKKEEKFGFGGKKRFAKSNDAKSSGDMRGFSVKGMKGRGGTARGGAGRGGASRGGASRGGGGRGGMQRPGKARRAKAF